MRKGVASYLEDLEAARKQYGPGCARTVENLLLVAGKYEFSTAESLIHFHDTLLFLRAFPHSRKVVAVTEQLLDDVARRVSLLRDSDAAMDLFDDEEFSGIAGTNIREDFTYEVARWLWQQHPHEISSDWDLEDVGRQLSSSLPQVMPLLADDCLVEADTPYLRWLSDAAGGKRGILSWILQRLEEMPLTMLEKTAWYDALKIYVSWNLADSRASRTRARRNPPTIHYHTAPLIPRNQVRLDHELASPALPLRKLSRQRANDVLDLARSALTVRYRELWGTTRGDPNQVMEADLGRGVRMFIWGLPPQSRLPLRAYHRGITVKNGVPINYFEAISLFEWVEVGFNTFYAFREGETGWIYSKLLHLLHQHTGVSCFSVYPYQLGADNEEAIRSGAFWFYRKLGFRPGDLEALRITEREEEKITANPGYRTSARTLRKLAAEHAFYEFGDGKRGRWDKFSTRNVGFAVQRHIARKLGGDPDKMRRAATTRLAKNLSVTTARWSPPERAAFADFALVLDLAPEVARWTKSQKHSLVQIIRAKAGPDERDFLRRLQNHALLKEIFLSLSVKPGRNR